MDRIGIDLTLLIPGRVGGVETYARSLIAGLAKLDQKNSYVLFGSQATLDSIKLDNENFARQLVIPPRGLSNFSFRLTRRFLWDAMEFDLASWKIGQQKVALLHEPLGLVRIHTPSPVVLTVMDIQHEFYPAFFNKGDLQFRRRWYPKSMRSASSIIAISEFTRETIIEHYGIEPQKVVTIHFGLDQGFCPITDSTRLQEIIAKYDLPERFVYYPANSWPHKNHARLLAALALLKERGQLDFKLVLAGVVYPEHQDLFKIIEEHHLAGDVQHIGHAPLADQPCLYSLAQCLVFPSLFEGFGYPVLEAMGCGCPVVCANVTSLPEIGGDAVRLFDPASEEDIADALVAVVQDEAVRAELIRCGHQRAQQFSWQDKVMQTLGVYERFGSVAA